MVNGPPILAMLMLALSLLQGWVSNPRPTAVEVRTGYAYSKHDQKRTSGFQIIPLQAAVEVPLTEPMGPAWFHGRIAWTPEIFGAMIIHPYDRWMAGASPLQFRYTLEPMGNWSLYGFSTLGVVHANIERPETGSDFNFMVGLGLGTKYALSQNASLILEYRRVHISNAGIDERNKGIDANNFLVGFSRRI